jgi:hypothetical protein
MLHQHFPRKGTLSKHINLSKTCLAKMVDGHSDIVYAYVMSTVVMEEGELRQTGTGPNFQGGYITLCTCKHRMRTSLANENWPNKWLAGFSSVKCDHRHWLFYLAKVEAAFESYSDLWQSAFLSDRSLEEKCARYSELGDLYEPKRILNCESRYDPDNYHAPISGHRHNVVRAGNLLWPVDIDYKRKKLKYEPKRPSLLIGDPGFSFLWRTPTLYIDRNWRHTIYDGLAGFLDDLIEIKRNHDEETGSAAARRRGRGVRRNSGTVVC